MSTLRLKPRPYDYENDGARRDDHKFRFDTARDNSGGRTICPYCYSPPIQGDLRVPPSQRMHCRCTP